ncbi:MAG: hypothetical protein FJ388_19390, partial [Verrucomicrobia bacterium]|nr:hypothetical protein [Verrucomicrobiota bacterium]
MKPNLVRSTSLSLLLLLGHCTRCFADVSFKLTDATIMLDSRGCVTSLRSADEQEYAPPGAPAAFEVAAGDSVVRPTAVARKGNKLMVEFGEHGRLQFAVTEGR